MDLIIKVPRPRINRPDLILVLELKLESSEHGNQLERYEISAQDAWPDAERYFFFLSPGDEQPSRENWVDVPFQKIIDDFERTLETGEGVPQARNMIQSYIALMRRRYVSDERLKELALRIWNRHGAALEFLMDHQPNITNDLSEEIRSESLVDSINSRLSDKNSDLRFVKDDVGGYYTRLAVTDWDSIEGMLASENWTKSGRIFLLEIEVNKTGCHSRWVVGRGPQEIRKAFVQTLAPNRVRGISPQYTRLKSRNVLTRESLRKSEDTGLDDGTIKKVIDRLAKYASETCVDFDNTFRSAGWI